MEFAVYVGLAFAGLCIMFGLLVLGAAMWEIARQLSRVADAIQQFQTPPSPDEEN